MEIVIDVLVPLLSFVLGLGILAKPLSKAKAVITELADLISSVDLALEDGKLSKTELEDIVQDVRDIIELF